MAGNRGGKRGSGSNKGGNNNNNDNNKNKSKKGNNDNHSRGKDNGKGNNNKKKKKKKKKNNNNNNSNNNNQRNNNNNSNSNSSWMPKADYNWSRNARFDDGGDVQMSGTYDLKGVQPHRYEARKDHLDEYYREWWKIQTYEAQGLLVSGRFVHFEITFGQADWEMPDCIPEDEWKRLYDDVEMPDMDDYAYVVSSLEDVDKAHLRTRAAKRDWDLTLEKKKQEWALKTFKIQKRKLPVRKGECVECKALNGAHGFRFAIGGREIVVKTCSRCRIA
ncbi:MAG: hypothetical protein MMC33_010426 [Icmadophila ericetorum]|nr:hypothetical protein [Icmadophila ericetorum]